MFITCEQHDDFCTNHFKFVGFACYRPHFGWEREREKRNQGNNYSSIHYDDWIKPLTCFR